MTYNTNLDPITESVITMNLYRNVQNVPEIREKMLKGEVNCCIIKPELIVDPFQVVIAANKALTAQKLTTKTVESEILFNLSLSKNINQSLQKYGIDDNTKDLLVATICKKNAEGNTSEVFDLIQGEQIDFTELKSLTNFELMKKEYKIGSDVTMENLLDTIVCKIATKDFL